MGVDGRPTTFHDLSAEEIAPGLVLDAPVNGFNGWMGMSIVRTLYHITGDEELGRFYYEELVGARGYLDVTRESIALMYFANETNFSNVNMAFVAAYGLLRYESDPEVGAQIRGILGTELYARRGASGSRAGPAVLRLHLFGIPPCWRDGERRGRAQRGPRDAARVPGSAHLERRRDQLR
jgi:hypothetical protein